MTTLTAIHENHARGYQVTFSVVIDRPDDAPQPCTLLEALGEDGPEEVSEELRYLLERDVDIELARGGALWESLVAAFLEEREAVRDGAREAYWEGQRELRAGL